MTSTNVSVPITRNGKTHYGTISRPAPPRDWDRLFLGAVTTVAILIGAGCVAWSTASIGSLLSTIAPAPVAYSAAGAYDLLWMSCAVLEWLARYEPDQARWPQRAGVVFLLVAMAALVTEGVLSHGTAAGIFGACLSAGVKAIWMMLTRRHAQRLDPLTQQWVDQELAEASGQLALASVQRRLTRSASQLAAYRAAFPVADGHQPDPDRPSGQPADNVSPTVRSAVRAALELSPEAGHEDIVEQLARLGIDTDAATVRDLSGQTDSRSATLLRLADHRGSDNLSATVRLIVRDGVTDPDTVLALVRWVHGHEVKPDTVERTLRRVVG